MRSLIGTVLRVLGWGLAAWSLVAGVGFIAILMINFVGTHGAESGRDILVVLAVATTGTLLGVGIAKLGRYLSADHS